MEDCFSYVVSNPAAKGRAGWPVCTVGHHHAQCSVSCLFLQMMRFAWQSYRRYAMGKNELRPLTKDGYEGNMFGELPSGRATAPWWPSGIVLLAFHFAGSVPFP